MAKPERAYSVWLHDRKVGTLNTDGGYTRFAFDTEYARDPNRAVLGLRFEEDLLAQHRSNVRLPPWFSNLLPEGRLREWIAHSQRIFETREMELLAQVGHDLPGAVRVAEDGGLLHTNRAAPHREVVTGGSEATGSEGNVWRFSLAGVAMKFSMLQAGERFTAPGVGEGGDWIVKLPDPLYPQVPLNEFAMMQLAAISGLNVPEIRLVHRDLLEDVPPNLWPTGEDQAYAVRRFDRDDSRNRVHMEDFAQVRGFYPESKYRGSFETLAALVYRQRDVASLCEFAKRLAFNVVIGNGDAHLKNWSLLYTDPRIPALAPAYDLVATAIYRPRKSPEDLGLKFGESRKFEAVSLSTFARLQRRLNAKDLSLPDEVRGLVARLQAGWPQVRELLKEHPLLVNEIGAGITRRAASLLRTRK